MPYNFYIVSLGCCFLAAAAAAIGSFSFLRKQALVGDAIAHAVLPGICLGFMFSGTKNPLYLIIGASVTAWVSTYAIEYITKNSKIKQDTAIATVLSVFFGLGIVLLTLIQQSGNAAQSGLDAFLFGQAASINLSEMYWFLTLSTIISLFIILGYPYLYAFSFDPAYTAAIGMGKKTISFLLTTAIVLAVVSGIQAVGVVLMAALLITPAAAARYWTHRLPVFLLVSAAIGAFSGLSGALISFYIPKMPTGPWIVVSLSLIALFSVVLAPNRGVLPNYWRQKRIQKKFALENVLKSIYQVLEAKGDLNATFDKKEIINRKSYKLSQLESVLKKLKSKGAVIVADNRLKLSEEGIKQAARLVKLHRLWELYLTEYLRIAPDHVHDDAETIEHIITPEIEERLEKKLNYPVKDPHSSPIPYQS